MHGGTSSWRYYVRKLIKPVSCSFQSVAFGQRSLRSLCYRLLNMVQARHCEYGILAFEGRMKARTVICELGSRGCKVLGPEWRIRPVV